MQTATVNKIVDSYFKLMRNWDNETKKNLIVKLTQSIDTKDKKQRDFSSCFGAWEDSRTAEQIIEDLKTDRVDNPEIENF